MNDLFYRIKEQLKELEDGFFEICIEPEMVIVRGEIYSELIEECDPPDPDIFSYEVIIFEIFQVDEMGKRISVDIDKKELKIYLQCELK